MKNYHIFTEEKYVIIWIDANRLNRSIPVKNQSRFNQSTVINRVKFTSRDLKCGRSRPFPEILHQIDVVPQSLICTAKWKVINWSEAFKRCHDFTCNMWHVFTIKFFFCWSEVCWTSLRLYSDKKSSHSWCLCVVHGLFSLFISTILLFHHSKIWNYFWKIKFYDFWQSEK